MTCHNNTSLALEDTNCTNGEVRLVGGETKFEGRVELCYDNRWGEVCPISWNIQEAQLVCKQLGLPIIGANVITTLGRGVAPLHNIQFGCTGDESSLLDCSFTTAQCRVNYHAGVHCEG